ncbi:MAG: Rpn family recombination-promoting nuclease/putative transposase, partial [Chlamydiota bacterium]
MAKYLDPKADVVFKKIFADHPHLLISFLNSVLPLPSDRPILSIEYLPMEQVPEIPAFKRTIVDVKCKDKLGRVFIVEMQIDWTDSFKQRLLFSTSQAIVKQLNKGQTYQLLQPVYGLGIIADTWNTEDPEWYHHYRLVKKGEKKEDIIEHLQLIFIELPKFTPHSREEKQLRLLWLRFLREIDEKTINVSSDLLSVPEICEAIELAEQAAYTPAELSAYDAYWGSVRTERTLMQGKYEEGEAKGKAEGLSEGKARGLAEGKAEGKLEQAHITVFRSHEA